MKLVSLLPSTSKKHRAERENSRLQRQVPWSPAFLGREISIAFRKKRRRKEANFLHRSCEGHVDSAFFSEQPKGHNFSSYCSRLAERDLRQTHLRKWKACVQFKLYCPLHNKNDACGDCERLKYYLSSGRNSQLRHNQQGDQGSLLRQEAKAAVQVDINDCQDALESHLCEAK